MTFFGQWHPGSCIHLETIGPDCLCWWQAICAIWTVWWHGSPFLVARPQMNCPDRFTGGLLSCSMSSLLMFIEIILYKLITYISYSKPARIDKRVSGGPDRWRVEVLSPQLGFQGQQTGTTLRLKKLNCLSRVTKASLRSHRKAFKKILTITGSFSFFPEK